MRSALGGLGGQRGVSDRAARAPQWCESPAKMCDPEQVLLLKRALLCMVGRIMTPQRCPHLGPQTLNMNKEARLRGRSQGKRQRDSATVIKVKEFEMGR